MPDSVRNAPIELFRYSLLARYNQPRMSKLEEVERLLSEMTRSEKAQLLQWVVRDIGKPFPVSKQIQRSAVVNPALCGPVSQYGSWKRRDVWELLKLTS